VTLDHVAQVDNEIRGGGAHLGNELWQHLLRRPGMPCNVRGIARCAGSIAEGAAVVRRVEVVRIAHNGQRAGGEGRPKDPPAGS